MAEAANGLPALAAAVVAVGDGSGGSDEVRRLSALVDGLGACSHQDGTVRLVASMLAAFPEEVSAHAQAVPEPESGVRMKHARGRLLQVDWHACMGRVGVCHEVSPESIDLDEWVFPIVNGPVSTDLMAGAREAVRVCPQLALRLGAEN